jgi:hypothetical protein
MAGELLITAEHALLFISLLVLIWAWGTFAAYVKSNRKMLSTEFKKIVMWVMAGILFFAIRTTLEILTYIMILDSTKAMLLVLEIFSFSSAFSFVISAYHLYQFSKKYGFAEKTNRFVGMKKG